MNLFWLVSIHSSRQPYGVCRLRLLVSMQTYIFKKKKRKEKEVELVFANTNKTIDHFNKDYTTQLEQYLKTK